MRFSKTNSLLSAFVILTFFLSAIGSSVAQQQATPPRPLIAGVYISTPFVTKDGDRYSGMAIELWEKSAKALGRTYEYRDYPSFEALITAVENGEVETAISNLTITKERAARLLFSQPWYDAGLRIMVANENSSGFWQVISGLENAGHLRAMLWLMAFIVLATIFLAFFYRRFDKSFPRKWHVGLAESFYEVMSVTTSGKITRPNVLGWLGRISGGLWMVCGVAVIAYVTSSVTSVMTALSLTHQINSIADLPGRTVGVLGGSVAEIYGRGLRLDVRSFAATQDAIDALDNGEVDAIVGDAPVLEYFVHSNPGSAFSVVGAIFHPDKYGFGFQHNNHLGHEVTLQILAQQETGELGVLRRKYFGNQQ